MLAFDCCDTRGLHCEGGTILFLFQVGRSLRNTDNIVVVCIPNSGHGALTCTTATSAILDFGVAIAKSAYLLSGPALTSGDCPASLAVLHHFISFFVRNKLTASTLLGRWFLQPLCHHLLRNAVVNPRNTHSFLIIQHKLSEGGRYL